MAVHDILRMGDERLLQRSCEITEFNTPELHALVSDMRQTMAAYDGAGLAAPQIGVLQRVVIFGVDYNPRYPDAETVPETILINPVITPLSDAMEEAWEGCLSLPEMNGLVPRYEHIRYRGFDPCGGVIEREVHGFHARVAQHECDHLDGILYPVRMPDMRRFGFSDTLFPDTEAAPLSE